MKLILFLAAMGVEPYELTQVQYMILASCLNREDRDTATKLLNDWLEKEKKIYITKWIPGSHYYVNRVKFDTYTQAKEYVELIGYKCLGVQHRYIYGGSE